MGNESKQRSASRDRVRPAALWDMDRTEPTGGRRSKIRAESRWAKTRSKLGEFWREWNGETDQRQGRGC